MIAVIDTDIGHVFRLVTWAACWTPSPPPGQWNPGILWRLRRWNRYGVRPTSVVVTVNLLKHGELLDCCVCNLSCLLCSVLWIHAVSDHAAQGPLRAHATYLSTEWGSWPCICVRQWGKPLQWSFVVCEPIRFPGQVKGKHHKLRWNMLVYMSRCVFSYFFNVCTGFPGPVAERHCAGDERHWTAGGHCGHPRREHGQGELWQQDQWLQGKRTRLIP